jgi:hypothetical protein
MRGLLTQCWEGITAVIEGGYEVWVEVFRGFSAGQFYYRWMVLEKSSTLPLRAGQDLTGKAKKQ